MFIIVIIFSQHETNPHGNKADPNFQYGTTSVGVALSVLIVTLLVIIVSLVLTHRARKSSYVADDRRRDYNDDERRLLESPTSEEEAEILRSGSRQVNSITEAADRLITVTATAVDNTFINEGEHTAEVGNQ